MLEWFHVRWFALRNAAQIADTMKRADERIELLLQQVDARDKALTRATRRIDELEMARAEAIDAAIKEQRAADDLEKELHRCNGAFQKLQDEAAAANAFADGYQQRIRDLEAQLQKLEAMGEKEYPVLPASASNGRTRRKKVAETGGK